ncbi:MAG: hypothetical protein EOO43_00950 [Flavobacterium sp.]|nr:MAG: hypothetical protein EOO43_00950 [Flavobacterium sp.]
MAEEIEDKKSRSPFKDVVELKKEIIDFINIFKTTVADHSDRISNYFEMSCFNYVVKYYQLQGYNVTIQNLQLNQYRYKCSPSGIQSNFSHFRISKICNGKTHEYEIHHNLAVESAHEKGIYTTPDITIIDIDSVSYNNQVYETKKRFSYVAQVKFVTFCEVKNFNPFSELIFNFMGVVNELAPKILNNTMTARETVHIAPCLMISGTPNKQTSAIKKSIESRYCVNVIYQMFYSASFTFSKSNIKQLRTHGALTEFVSSKAVDPIDKFLEVLISQESQ